FVFGGGQIELRCFEILFRDAAFFIQNAASLVDRASVVDLRARVQQGFLIFGVGFGNRAGDETALVRTRFVQGRDRFVALRLEIARLEYGDHFTGANDP